MAPVTPGDGGKDANLISIGQRRVEARTLTHIPAVQEHSHPERAILPKDAPLKPRLLGDAIGQGLSNGSSRAVEPRDAAWARYADREA